MHDDKEGGANEGRAQELAPAVAHTMEMATEREDRALGGVGGDDEAIGGRQV